MSKNPTESRPTRKQKPNKPYEGFPLFAHPSGQWAQKINGSLRYIGVWADPAAALERHNHDFPFLKDGRTPPPLTSDGVTMRELANAFLRAKEANWMSANSRPEHSVIITGQVRRSSNSLERIAVSLICGRAISRNCGRLSRSRWGR